MESNPNFIPSPWYPRIPNPILGAVLGKLGEECNELSGRIFRIMIQGGIEEPDPETGRSNLDELLRELADVQAGIDVFFDYMKLAPLEGRIDDKERHYYRWHKMISFMEMGMSAEDAQSAVKQEAHLTG